MPQSSLTALTATYRRGREKKGAILPLGQGTEWENYTAMMVIDVRACRYYVLITVS